MNTQSDNSTNAWEDLLAGGAEAHWREYAGADLPACWRVENDTLLLDKHAESGETGTLGTGIVTRKMWDDFELQLEWKLWPGGNSGIFYRVSEAHPRPNYTGPEMQILDDERHPDAQKGPERLAGACYQLYAPTERAKPTGEWNAVKIIAQGPQIEHWLNGTCVVRYELGSTDWQARVAQSKFRDLPDYGKQPTGHILLQDHGHRVAFRTPRIRALSRTAPCPPTPVY